MRGTIDGASLAQMVIHAAASINSQKQQINELNVFPVPDGDTGTNMSMTISTAAAELKKKAPAGVGAVAQTNANALLRGARGNSGVILSLLFRGFAKALKDKEQADGGDFAVALDYGVATAYKAVMKPAEGPILTVSRLAARRAAEAAREDRSVEFVLDELRGEPMPAGTEDEAPSKVQEHADFGTFKTEDIKFGYCTEFICSRDSKKDPEALRGFLSALGDSLVLVDDDEIIKVHVHTNHPGKVLEEAITYGSLQTVKIENMRNQHTEILEEAAGHPAEQEEVRKVAPPEKKYGFVSVCAGDGISAVFRDLGVDGIISGGQTMNPSTEDIMKEIDKTPAEVVYVLPNNKNIIMAAEQCVPLAEGKTVVVLPSKTIPQGVSALLCFAPDASQEDNTQAMTQALGNVHTSQITYAARNSDFDGFDIKEGDYLALSESQLFGTDRDILALLRRLAQDAPQKEAEFITVYYGEDVTESQAQTALEIFTAECPNAEITLLSGGQPVYYYLISAE